MGSGRNPSIKPDLFSAQQSPDTSSPSASEPKSSPLRTEEPAAASTPFYALPTNLPSAIRHLDDDQLADAQRKLCRDWLLYIMASSSVRTRTKDDLRAEAMKRLKVSKSAFDVAWTWAIEKTGNRHWYEPLPKSRKKTARTLLA
jgi:hypothetical protein